MQGLTDWVPEQRCACWGAGPQGAVKMVSGIGLLCLHRACMQLVSASSTPALQV